MRITTQGEYGLRCIRALTRNSAPLSIKEVSTSEKLSKPYVEQLFLKLRRAGLIRSLRGPKGGYVLAKSPSRIKVNEIIKALEGDTFEVICERRKSRCIHIDECSLRPLWKALKERVDDLLEKVTLQTLHGEEIEVTKRLRGL